MYLSRTKLIGEIIFPKLDLPFSIIMLVGETLQILFDFLFSSMKITFELLTFRLKADFSEIQSQDMSSSCFLLKFKPLLN